MDDRDLTPLKGLPEELAELDRELAELHMEERPSFAPELEAELARAWADGPDAAPEEPVLTGVGRSMALAATIALLLVAGVVTVPPARAALADASRQALLNLGVITASPGPAPERSGPAVNPVAERETPRAEEPQPEMPVRAVDLPPAAGTDDGRTAEGGEEEIPPYPVLSVTFPELVDREADEAAIRRHYPRSLQRSGIGGTVGLRLWVDSLGRVDEVVVRAPSDLEELNEAARRAAGELRFRAATRNGGRVGTWVDFDMVFSPREEDRALPTVGELEAPLAPELGPDRGAWTDPETVTPPISLEARDLLRTALGPTSQALRVLGSLDRILAGEPPPDRSPLRWRSEVSEALREAIAKDPENPAPYLALGRVYEKQGREEEALDVFRDGLARAQAGVRVVSPRVVALLSYELGTALRSSWRSWEGLGTVGDALPECPVGRSLRSGSSAERIGVMNYLCPGSVDRFLDRHFQPVLPGTDLRGESLRALEDAVARYPGHVGANVALLQALVAEERWYDVLNGARRFAWASEGHSRSLLFAGIALQRLGRSEEALEELRRALWTVSEEEASALRDIRTLLPPDSLAAYEHLDLEGREAYRESYWRGRDPILATAVNETRVEHVARTAEALLRFGTVESDPASVWIRYGPPRRIRTLGAGTELRTEFWDYGSGPDLVFRRMAAAEDLHLTREGATYVDELWHLFGHWYGASSRPVRELAAQVVLFGTGDTRELHIRSTIPAALATDGSDSVEVGVYFVGDGGRPLGALRRSHPARVSSLELRTPILAGARKAIVEVWHPGLSEAASTVRTLELDDPGTETVSEVLLLDPLPARVTRVGRNVPELGALPSARTTGDRVGLLLELYGALDTAGTRIEVDAVEEGGPVRSLTPVRSISGEAGARYLELDLGALPFGPVELRVRIRGAGGDTVLRTVRLERMEGLGREAVEEVDR